MSTRSPRQKGDRPLSEDTLQEARRLAAANNAAVARNLARLYGEVLDAPLPDDLAALIRRLETRKAGPR
jgi:anti-sigma factor NepR-like protein